MKVVIVESETGDDWLEPFTNVIEVIKNTFSQLLNVGQTLLSLAFTMDESQAYQILDKYYDRMKSINAKTEEVMKKIEQSAGDMNLFTFLYNPTSAITARILTGGPGALRNFIDYYKEATGVSLNPFDIGPPGARDSTSLMNNRMNYAMGYGYGGASGGGRGTASSRTSQQLERRLNRAFGIELTVGAARGVRPGTPRPPTRFETFAGVGLPILVEATNPDPGAPLSDAEFKKAVSHFMKQVDFGKLGLKSEASQVSADMSRLADEMSKTLSNPYDLLMRLSKVQSPSELYEILNEMKKAGFQITGLESLRPEKINIMVDDAVNQAKDENKVDDLFKISTVKPKDPKSPTEDEIKSAAQEAISKTIMSKTVSESKKQIEPALIKMKEGILKKFDEMFIPRNTEDAKLLMNTKFGNDYKSARARLQAAGIPLQNQMTVDTKP